MEKDESIYIQGILHNKTQILEEIYERFFPPVYSMLRNNQASYDDARDVFQEALVVIFNHAARPGFQLTAPFQAYLMGIGRFIWLRQLKKNSRTEVTSNPEERYDIDADLELQVFELEKRNLYREKFERLGPDCKQLLQRFFDREPLQSIAADMGFTADYVKKKNKVCKDKLIEAIQKDRRFNEISTSSRSNKTDTSAYE
ncbi:MAG: sigma-70 family RNA polymerase sigma factor [Saprospiraceae bacterium]|nr:sigma-70 family RNA polymerase sigma factor [Saprospiraceae bacterium]